MKNSNKIVKHPSDSKIQREIEEKVVRQIFSKTDKDVVIKKVSIQNINFEFDYYDEKDKIMCEVYAGIDNLSSGAKEKINCGLLQISVCRKIIRFRISKNTCLYK